jgi:hypothetical protein
MGEDQRFATGVPVEEHGIYQSACGCRTALTLLAGQLLPQCLGCDQAVDWRLVQTIRPSDPPARGKSSTRLRSTSRPPLDSASGKG